MNTRTSVAFCSLLAVLLPVVADAATRPSAGVFARTAAERLERFCGSALAKRRPYACSRFLASASSSSFSSSSPRPLRPVIPSSSSRWSSSSSVVSGFDSKPAEPVRSQILVLGETTPTLASVRFTSTVEPIDINYVTVSLAGPVTSLEALKIYNLDGRFVATASRDTTDTSNMTYRATIPSQALSIDKAADETFYIRGVLKGFRQGGVSGEVVEIDHVTLDATGAWSTSPYVISSTETLPASQTARGRISLVRSLQTNNQVLSTGPNQLLWDFEIGGEMGDGEASLSLTKLLFNLSIANVSLTNVRIETLDGAAAVSCSVGSGIVTCNGIGSILGAIPADGSQRLRVVGDIAIIGSPNIAYVQLSLNEPGSVSTPGSIEWSDGTEVIQWVAVDGPIAVGPRRTM